MKKSLSLIVLFISMFVFSQDNISKHNGESISGKVIRVNEYTVIFAYENETAENVESMYAIDKITFASGRVQKLSDKIVVRSENDWEKVVILEDKSYIAGLKKGNEIKGKTGFVSFHTGNSADNKATKKLKMEAAAAGFPFILMTADKDFNQSGQNGPTFGAIQSVRKGVTYKY